MSHTIYKPELGILNPQSFSDRRRQSQCEQADGRHGHSKLSTRDSYP